MKPFLLVTLVFGCFSAAAQSADSNNAKPDERFKSDLLVVVAHPDDETEIGAYLAREGHAIDAYASEADAHAPFRKGEPTAPPR